MYYAALDVHKETFYATVLNEKNEVVAEGEYPYNEEALIVSPNVNSFMLL